VFVVDTDRHKKKKGKLAVTTALEGPAACAPTSRRARNGVTAVGFTERREAEKGGSVLRRGTEKERKCKRDAAREKGAKGCFSPRTQ